MGDLVSTGEAAELLGVSSQTIRDWVRAKRLKAVELPSGQLRIPQDEIDRIRMTAERGGE